MPIPYCCNDGTLSRLPAAKRSAAFQERPKQRFRPVICQLLLLVITTLSIPSVKAQTDSHAPAMAPGAGAVARPLALPSDPIATCTLAALKETTRCPNFYEKLYSKVEADDDCCTLLMAAFGDDSTVSTRNCWCDPTAWAAEQAWELESYFGLSGILTACGLPYYQDGAGACAGMPDPAPVVAEAPSPLPSFGQWLRDIPQNGGVLFSVIFAVPSAIGFLFVIWPFLFHAALDAAEFVKRKSV